MTPEEKQYLMEQLTALLKSNEPMSYLSRLIRSLALVVKDENNLCRNWIQDFKTQVNLATSLADLKNRVAQLPDMPARTAQQALNAILDKAAEQEAD